MSFSSPAAGATVSGTLTVSGIASDNVKVSKVEVKVDSGSFKLATGTTSWTVSIDTKAYTNGSHTLTTRATDSSGNTAKANRTVTISNSASATRIYWGGWVGSQFTGTQAPWDWNAVTAFEQRNAAGKHLSVVHWSSPFRNVSTGSTYGFGTSTFQSVRDHGVIPFFSWANSGIADKDIASGFWDSYISSWASAAKSWGHPFFLRYDWEMNGSWFSWGVGKNGTTAADFVAAWRHVHDIFVRVGATNVTWVWCPNVDPGGIFASFSSVYPGNSYVDWTCLDGYNGNDPWGSFTHLFGSTYDTIMQIAPSKPMIIGEVGSTESGGSKAQWINDMFAALPSRFPNIHGVLWMDRYVTGPGGYADWPAETSASASSAFAAGVGSTTFTTNTFATLIASPVPVPG